MITDTTEIIDNNEYFQYIYVLIITLLFITLTLSLLIYAIRYSH